MYRQEEEGGGGHQNAKESFQLVTLRIKKKGRMGFALCSIAEKIDVQLCAATAQLLMEKF